MSTFPNSPRIQKGALIGLDPFSPLASVTVFQYNPEKMTRQLEARTMNQSEAGDRTEVLRLEGPPKETISLKIELDASDQLDRGDPTAAAMGVYPALSALELLLYPESKIISAIGALANQGIMEVIPPEMPLTLFVWGMNRVVPVRLTSMTINEEAYDPQLNPIQAQVDLSLQVLTTHDFAPDHPGYPLYLVHQIAKEAMGLIGGVHSIADLGFSLRL